MRQPFADGAGKIRIAEHTDPRTIAGPWFTAGTVANRDRLRQTGLEKAAAGLRSLRHGLRSRRINR